MKKNNIDSKFDISNYALYSQLSLPISSKLILSSTIRKDINKINQNLKYEYYDYDNYPYDYYYYPQQGEYNKHIKNNNIHSKVLFRSQIVLNTYPENLLLVCVGKGS